ncbi:ATP/GTP-binding protein [Bifidobacterium xylocopae]|uniref:ATP/GTP-binding protein n=1 Tax=Bifidobacterium xylocopae TaxID=2493119 RepID=UPI000FDED483|nr:ATP/GTP-binding protein [Bifidobacterium xylocopae]
MWPFAIGAGTPMTGVPLGRHLHTGASLCCDPITWFTRAHLISNPSAFILGKPGLGKSTIVRRWAVGLAAYGVIPMFLGDVKAEHIDVVRALGGQVIPLGRNRGSINVLDPGGALAMLQRLHGEHRRELADIIHSRRLNVVCALITIVRGSPPTDRESTILDRALHVLDEHTGGRVPVMGDLLQVLRDHPQEVRTVALDRGSLDRYREITENLEVSLIALSGSGRFGNLFSRATTEQIQLDRPVVFDISAIDEGDVDVRAAALLACWDAGFCLVDAAHILAEELGVRPRHYFVVLDELWQALRSGTGMVDRVDAVTRLNRSFGVGQVLISHTMSDLLSLPTEMDRMKAQGFVERSGMVVCGGLPAKEMPLLDTAVTLSDREQALLESWQDPPAWDARRGMEAEPPGRGKFLIKIGGRPGIPFHLDLTEAERHINDTNKLWHLPGQRV